MKVMVALINIINNFKKRIKVNSIIFIMFVLILKKMKKKKRRKQFCLQRPLWKWQTLPHLLQPMTGPIVLNKNLLGCQSALISFELNFMQRQKKIRFPSCPHLIYGEVWIILIKFISCSWESQEKHLYIMRAVHLIDL